jgi:hypothetical protein
MKRLTARARVDLEEEKSGLSLGVGEVNRPYVTDGDRGKWEMDVQLWTYLSFY